jgi:hypothetical protein
MSTNPPEGGSTGLAEPTKRWLVLAGGVGHDAIDDALSAAGFRLVNAVPRTDMHFWQRIYARAGGTIYVHDVIDHVMAKRYLVLAGREVEGVEAELRRTLPVLEMAEPATSIAEPSAPPSAAR